ncbi:MAG: hypothetical protein GXO43_04990 [Crenarchaeota archaeon]|nr:hypothetical protein [Thermoproteota archaeon]
MHIAKTAILLSIVMLVLVLGSAASAAYLPPHLPPRRPIPPGSNPSDPPSGTVVKLPSVIYGSYSYDADGRDIILTGKTTFYSEVENSYVGRINIYDAHTVYVKDVEIRIASAELKTSGNGALVTISADYIKGNTIKVDYSGKVILTGYLSDYDTVDLNILNLRYTYGLSLGGVDVKLHPSSIEVDTSYSSLTSNSKIFLDVYPFTVYPGLSDRVVSTRGTLSNVNVYVSIPKTVYHKYVTVQNVIGMNVWSYPQYYSGINPLDTHNKLHIGIYRFTAPELTGFWRMELVGLQTKSVDVSLNYYQFSDISMSESHKTLVFGTVTPLGVASVYPTSPQDYQVNPTDAPGFLSVDYLYVSDIKIKSYNVYYSLYSGGINTYGRITVGSVTETGIGLEEKNVALTGIVSYSWLSCLARASSSTSNFRKWMWFPAFNLTINRPFQVRPLELYSRSKGVVEDGLKSIKGIGIFIPNNNILVYYKVEGSDTVKSMIVKKFSTITLRLNMRLDKPDHYQLLLVNRNAASIALYDPSGHPSITLRIGNKVFHVSQVAFGLRGIIITRYTASFADGKTQSLISFIPITTGFISNRI